MPTLEQMAASLYAPQPAPKPPAATPAEAVEAFPALAPAAPAVPTAPPATQPKPPSLVEAGEVIYGNVAPTRNFVDWEEPPAVASEMELHAPVGLLDTSDAGRGVLGRLREGLAEAGAGRTLAAELFADAVRAEQGAEFKISRTSAEADLRREFGASYDAKVAAAQSVVAEVAKKCPEIYDFLNRTGLGNDPGFIRKVAAAAGRRRR